MNDTAMPYTHWAYFAERSAADACALELTALDCLVGIDKEAEPAMWGEVLGQWLLRAARTVLVSELVERHEEAAIVERHGGFYDGGESGWLNRETGRFL